MFTRAQERFNEPQFAHLLWTVTVINAYNRLAIATTPGGQGEPGSRWLIRTARGHGFPVWTV